MAPFLMDAAAVVFALQTAQATVHGTVRNEATGQALADAVILLTDLNRSTATDSRFGISAMPSARCMRWSRLKGRLRSMWHCDPRPSDSVHSRPAPICGCAA
jgi:hypothetical protein